MVKLSFIKHQKKFRDVQTRTRQFNMNFGFEEMLLLKPDILILGSPLGHKSNQRL